MTLGEIMRCCFCGLVPGPDEYVEMVLRIERSPARQSFGAHRDCLSARLAPGFTLELEPLDDTW